MKLSRYNTKAVIKDGRVIYTPRREKVAIIAADPSYVMAPFDNADWEVWGCNSLWHFCGDSVGEFRADRWFEMHPMSVQTDKELDAIKSCPIPIYHLSDATKEHAPKGIPYPLETVTEKLPYHYFTCTFAYQIALAIYEGFTTIGLFGVELDKGTSRERTVEKACVEFWIGIALGSGIHVITPDGSRLCSQNKLYGYDYHQEVDEVNGIIDGIFFRRVTELEQSGLAERIPIDTNWQEGNA